MAIAAAPLIAMIRHGAYQQRENAPSALQPFPLTDAGAADVRTQARAFAQLLAERRWQIYPVVHSSNSLRAWQTAQLYIGELESLFAGTPRHIESEQLVERAVGSVANLTTSEIEAVLRGDPRYEAPPQGWKSDSHYCLPFTGAESLLHAGQRVAKYIEANLQFQHAEQVQLFFGHGAAFRHAACHLNVMALCDVGKLSMYHARPVILQRQQMAWQRVAGEWKTRQRGSEAKD